MSDDSFAIGPCGICHRPFAFDPERVPSARLKADASELDPDEPLRPVCQPCAERFSEALAKRGVEWAVPADAYTPLYRTPRGRAAALRLIQRAEEMD